MARAAGLDRNPIGSLFPKRDPNRYPPLTPGLSPVYAAIETTNCFNSFLLQESRSNGFGVAGF